MAVQPDERARPMAAVDILLGMPQDVNDVLESELPCGSTSRDRLRPISSLSRTPTPVMTGTL